MITEATRLTGHQPRLLDLFCCAGGAAMGMEWATLAEICEAIPPAYTQFIGGQLRDHIAAPRSAAA